MAERPARKDDHRPTLRVARLRDLRDGGVTRREIDGTGIVLIRNGGDVSAFGGNCPHAGAPLEEGAVCNGRLICPWHKAAFRVGDGAVLEPPALHGLEQYPISVDGDDVLVAAKPLGRLPARLRATDRTIAIVGSGAAGSAAAAELCRLGFDGRLTMIDAEGVAPYDRTSLSKFVLSGEMALNEVPRLHDPDWLRVNNVERIGAAATRIDPVAKRLYLSDHTQLDYDWALLAPGAVAKRPDIPGITLPGVLTLRNATDAAAIMGIARPGAHVVILGSSFIGLEAASALRKRGLEVTVVAPDDTPLARQFGPEIGGMFRRLHVANGVTFCLGTEATAIEGDRTATAVRLKNGDVLAADLVLVGVGVEPATKGLPGVPTAPDGAVVVDGRFEVTDGLYAAGDCAAFPFQERLVRIEHWRLAQQHGRRAAAAMLGMDARYDEVPFFWTYQYGKRFEYLGHASGWDRLRIVGNLDRQDFVALQIDKALVVGVVACQQECVTAMLIDRMREPLQEADALAVIERSV